MDRFRNGSTDWHNWMRDTMKIDPSDSKSIELVWAVIGRMRLDTDLAALPPEPRTCETKDDAYLSEWDKGFESGMTHTLPRAPQSADIETVREARKEIQEAHDYMMDGMSSYKWQQAYGHICCALAALDRIAGKEES